MTGRNGKDLIISVPCGTVAWDQESGECLGEVIEPDQTLMLARGGRGGLGNLHFVSSTNRTPRQFTPGGENEKKVIRLELKLIAQIGLVGYPNAGKSTLTCRLSGARPKTAAYPFTTLHPVLGVICFSDFRTLCMADLPGLIEGAHAGVGLGHDFLRHIERTQLLLFVVDCGGVDGRTPLADYQSLLLELEKYNPELLNRPRLLVANKMDVPGASEKLEEYMQATGETPLPISAKENQGLDALRHMLEKHFFPDDSSVPLP